MVKLINDANLPVSRASRVLNIPRRTVYNDRDKVPTKHAQTNDWLKTEIQRVFQAAKKRYGVIKITRQINTVHHTNFSERRVSGLMKTLGIQSNIIKKWRATQPSIGRQNLPNLVNQNFKTDTLNHIWTTDMTYIHTVHDGWTYLASVMDLHSRAIIGWAYGTKMTTELTLQALKKALNNRPAPVILHTDQGSQFLSQTYEETLKALNIRHSYSRPGVPYDNAVIESFHATLKKELVHHEHYRNLTAAKLSLFEYIESWYNRSRMHGSLNYLSPMTFETQLCA